MHCNNIIFYTKKKKKTKFRQTEEWRTILNSPASYNINQGRTQGWRLESLYNIYNII